MINFDHEAIRKAYPNVVVIDDNNEKIYEQIGEDENEGAILNDITSSIEQSKVDTARASLNADYAAKFYRKQRTGEAGTSDTIYAWVGDQLDMMYQDKLNGTTTWQDHIAAVKAKYPKPS